MVQPNGLQLSGELQALGKGVLPSLQNLVTERVANAGQEELVFEELGHVIHSF